VKLLLILVLALLQQPSKGLWSKVGEAVQCKHEAQVVTITSTDGQVYLIRRQFLICDGQRYRLEKYLLETSEAGSKEITLVVKKWDAETGRVTLQLFLAPKIEVVPVEEK